MLIATFLLAGALAGLQAPVPSPQARCLVCGGAIDGPPVAVQHRGRRLQLHAGDCERRWQESPETYFAALQPRAALFNEPANAAASGLASAWFVFGLYVLAGLICGAASAYVALARSRRPLPWFFAGLTLNVLALAAVLGLPAGAVARLPQGVPRGLRKVPLTHAPRRCPACSAANHPSARRCSGCGGGLEPSAESEVRTAAHPGGSP